MGTPLLLKRGSRGSQPSTLTHAEAIECIHPTQDKPPRAIPYTICRRQQAMSTLRSSINLSSNPRKQRSQTQDAQTKNRSQYVSPPPAKVETTQNRNNHKKKRTQEFLPKSFTPADYGYFSYFCLDAKVNRQAKVARSHPVREALRPEHGAVLVRYARHLRHGTVRRH